jgi:hypothetical protein
MCLLILLLDKKIQYRFISNSIIILKITLSLKGQSFFRHYSTLEGAKHSEEWHQHERLNDNNKW